MQNRRAFMKGSAVFATMMAAAPTILKAQGAPRVFKVAVVGCGGRGSGALKNSIAAAKQLGQEVKLVATADYFIENAKTLAKTHGLDEKFCFGGANGYKKVMDMPEVDIVILATPLNFRPRHLEAAVKAGKHVFAEKGVAVDAPGIRQFIAASKLAAEKKLTLVAGTQRRHASGYLLQAKALKEGKISPILGGNVYWNGTVPWIKRRTEAMSNKDYLCKNWLNFTELSGDHIVEQHVHNLDIANWFIGRYPKSAVGMGGRARRVTGNQFDFFSVDFDYGEGVHIHSMCRQLHKCHSFVGESFRTADAILSGGGRVTRPNGERIELSGDFLEGNPQEIEHVDLLKSILGTGPYLNEGETVAMSTACAIMGRISAYTGQIVGMADLLTKDSSPYYKGCALTAEAFEAEGDVELPAEVAPIPGSPDARFA
jgi:myo-inositol 2-dehydrogenase / D-chiro-inositol 1-dehydrogenase